MLVTLEPSALVWAPGLRDWLPLGDLPAPGELPPEPEGSDSHAEAKAAAPAEADPDE